MQKFSWELKNCFNFMVIKTKKRNTKVRGDILYCHKKKPLHIWLNQSCTNNFFINKGVWENLRLNENEVLKYLEADCLVLKKFKEICNRMKRFGTWDFCIVCCTVLNIILCIYLESVRVIWFYDRRLVKVRRTFCFIYNLEF